MSLPRSLPPTQWSILRHLEATGSGGRVFYRLLPHGDVVQVTHWCEAHDRWLTAAAALHTVTQLDPLTLVPSLGFTDCAPWAPGACGLHGWVVDGRWVGT